MTQADIIDIFEILPCPIYSSQLAIVLIFRADIVAGVVTHPAKVYTGIRLADMNRSVYFIMYNVSRFVDCHKYFYFVCCHITFNVSLLNHA